MSTIEVRVVDLGAAAFLLCKGFRHQELRPTGRDAQLAFIFTGEEARDEVKNYFCGSVISARQFTDALKAAKHLLYDKRPCYQKDGKGQGGAK